MAKSFRPIPNRKIEAQSSGSGPVKSWKMSPEEMEDYFARIAYKQDPQKLNIKEVDEVKNLESKKQEIISLIADGLTYGQVEAKLDLKKNTLRYHLKKLGLEGLNQVKALQMLGKIAKQPEDTEVQNKTLKEYEKKLAEWQHIEQELQQLKRENMDLKKELNESKVLHEASLEELKRINSRCVDLENELKKWSDNETQELLLEITSERDQYQKQAAELQVLLFEMTEDRDNWKLTAEEAKQALVELQAEYQKQPSVIIGAPIQPDMVNQPEHYTVGGIETIDFIRAKLSPAEFLGYCKGNVIKYMARANYKGGLEDIRKAGKYIEFAVKEA